MGVHGPNSSDPDLLDTVASPGKSKDMEVDRHDLTSSAAKRGLDMNEKDEILEAAKDTGNGYVAGGMPMITEGQAANGNPGGDLDKDRKKRTKKDGSNSSLGSAESHEGSVRSQ
jgi:hypothetical protein